MIDDRKYPVLKPLDEELKSKYAGGVTLDFILSTYNRIKDRAKERVNKLLKGEELEPYTQIEEPVLVFYTTLYLVIAFDNALLKKKFVEKEVELMMKNLMEEDEDVLLEIVSRFQDLKINKEKLIIKRREKRKTLIFAFSFSLHFVDYLKVTKELRKEDESFSLSRRILKDGKVFLTKDEVAKIVAYKIKDVLYEAVNVRYENIPEEVKKMADELKGRKTPPCIQSLMKKKGLNEIEKTVLVIYFINIGDYKSAEKISEELINKYQGDKKTKYILYSCTKMKKLGLCVTSCGTLNPLQHYYGKFESL